MLKIKSEQMYISYINGLKNKIFKILPLYEENNIEIDGYIKTLLIELYGLEEVFEHFERYNWYLSTLSVLETFIKKDVPLKDVRTNVLKIVNLIDREIERRGNFHV